MHLVQVDQRKFPRTWMVENVNRELVKYKGWCGVLSTMGSWTIDLVQIIIKLTFHRMPKQIKNPTGEIQGMVWRVIHYGILDNRPGPNYNQINLPPHA